MEVERSTSARTVHFNVSSIPDTIPTPVVKNLKVNFVIGVAARSFKKIMQYVAARNLCYSHSCRTGFESYPMRTVLLEERHLL